MPYISKGDLIEIKWRVGQQSTWLRAIAASDDYTRRVGGTGEFMDDYSFIPSVDYVVPEKGVSGVARLGDIRRV
jgi:hypothetical protein